MAKQIYEVTLPDGDTVRVRASTPESAQRAAAKHYSELIAEPEISKGASFGRGALDMVSMGFADEIGAGLETGFGYLGDYGKELADNRKWFDDAREANPWSYAGGQAVGAIAPALVTGGSSLAAKGLIGAAKAGAKYGAAEGALYGFGSGRDGITNRLKSAAAEGALGTVAGGLGGVAGRGIQGAVRGTGKGVESTAKNVAANMPGGNKLTSAERGAGREVARMIDKSGLKIGDALQDVKPGRPLAMQNVGMRNQAQGYSLANQGARQTMSDLAQDNFRKNVDGTLAGYRRELGGSPNGFEYMMGLRDKQAATARAGYGAAREATKSTPVSPEIQEQAMRAIDDMPGLIAAHKNRLGDINAGRAFDIVEQALPDGTKRRVFANNPTIGDMEALAATARKIGRKNPNSMGGDYGGNISMSVDRQVPNFRQPRADFAMDAQIQNAFDMGKKDAFLRTGGVKDANLFLYNFRNLGRGPDGAIDPKRAKILQDSVAKGLYSHIEDSVFSNPSSPDPIMRKMMKSEYGKRIIREVLGDNAAENLIKRAEDLDAAIQLRGNLNMDAYNTGRNIQDVKAVSMDPRSTIQIASQVAAGDLGATLDLLKPLGQVMGRDISQEEMEAVAKLLFETNPDQAARIIRGAAVGDQEAVRQLARAFDVVSSASVRGSARGYDVMGGGGF
jgi:hypothetical protein